MCDNADGFTSVRGDAKTYYYSAASQLIAMRQFTSPTQSVLYFLHGDHLGSTSLTTDASGNAVTRQLYDAWGNVCSGGGMPTDIGYTGQRLDNSTGLMYFRARYYAPGLGRFIRADTIVPDPSNPQSLNRFSYTRNNPLKYIDPTGHRETNGCDYEGCDGLRGSVYQRDGAAAPAEKFYRDCANGGGAECRSLREATTILKVFGTGFASLIGGPAAAMGFGSYTVANGTVSSLKAKDISHFFDEWDPVDAGLSALGGVLIANLPAKLMPFILGGQSAASDVLHGESPNALKAAANAGLGIVSAKLSGGLQEAFDPVKSQLSESVAGAIDGFGSVTVDTGVSLAVAAVEELPSQFGVFFVNVIRPVCLYTCR